MKNIISLFAAVFMFCSCTGQPTIKTYVLSFPFELKDSVLKSARLIQSNNARNTNKKL